MDYKLEIVVLLTVGFAFASLLGVVAARIKLPSILGFLIAGYLIGPYSPGFVADLHVAEQLAEIGVILMLFNVGLHFHLDDLMNVRRIAIPGAIGQTAVATLAGVVVACSIGWSLQQSFILGLAISVASTVVLVRVLSDNRLLDAMQGHIAVGWLVVEDILTIFMLVLLPAFALSNTSDGVSTLSVLQTIAIFLVKFTLLGLLLLKFGYKVVGWLLTIVARLRTHELFTISVLALTFIIATVSAYLFDTSIALGAFLAGMVIAKTDVRHQALANSLPLKDVFTVMFFLTIGMLFDPLTIWQNPTLFLGVLAIILIVKPVTAYLIVRFMRYPQKVSATVAIALAQIGEFSFILAEQATALKILPDIGYDILVACAFVSISLNPILFWLLPVLERREARIRALGAHEVPERIVQLAETRLVQYPEAIVVGFGPTGVAVAKTLEDNNMAVVAVESNIDALSRQRERSYRIMYGDAAVPAILQASELIRASILVITVPNIATTEAIIQSARQLHPSIYILARITNASEKARMEELEVDYVCAEDEIEKAMVQKALAYMSSTSF